jgi:hypothetical protein
MGHAIISSSTGLPVVSGGARQLLEALEAEHGDGTNNSWYNDMLRQLREENPEINSMLLELAQRSSDPKGVVMAGYKVYKLLELAEANERKLWRE